MSNERETAPALSPLKRRLGLACSTPAPGTPPEPGLRARLPAIAAATALAAWILLYQLQVYYGLETTSDPYVVAQLATSWLEGRFLQDHFFGNQLAAHTFLIAPALAPFVLLAGVPGLFIAAALSAGLSLLALDRLLRTFAVPAGPALAWSLLATAMPLSLHTYLDQDYGFHLELLVPALALWLAYFLVRRHWGGALALAGTLLLVKEDVTLVVGVVAVTVLIEDRVRARTQATGGGARWNRPALVALGLALLALPLLLAVIESAQTGRSSNLDRVRALHSTEVSSNFGLFSYAIANVGSWLTSPTARQWLTLAFAGTFGLLVLRPHLVPVGIATCGVAWLMKDNLLWPPRFYAPLTFIQLAGVLAFASLVQLLGATGARRATRATILCLLLAGIACGVLVQLRYLPRMGTAYRLEPYTRTTPAERRVAAAVFADYERLRRPGEPVIASPILFRFAAPRDLHWLQPFGVAPTAPTWILWDHRDRPLAELWAELRQGTGRGPADYELIAQADQFFLFRAKPGVVPLGNSR